MSRKRKCCNCDIIPINCGLSLPNDQISPIRYWDKYTNFLLIVNTNNIPPEYKYITQESCIKYELRDIIAGCYKDLDVKVSKIMDTQVDTAVKVKDAIKEILYYVLYNILCKPSISILCINESIQNISYPNDTPDLNESIIKQIEYFKIDAVYIINLK